MKKIVAISSVIAGLLLACGGAPSTASGANNDTNGGTQDDVTLPASSDTTSAIGVVRWGATYGGGTSTIHGYDDKDSVLVTVTHTVTNPSSQQSTVKDTVGGKLGSAALEVRMVAGEADADGNLDVTTTVVNNTFKAGSGPSQVLDAALADQGDDGSNWETSAANGSAVSLGTRSLHPDTTLSSGGASSSGSSGTSLVQCVGKTLSCATSIVTTVATGLKAAGSCGSLVTSLILVAKCALTGGGTGTGAGADAGAGPSLGGASCRRGLDGSTSKNGAACVQDGTAAVKGAAGTVGECGKDISSCSGSGNDSGNDPDIDTAKSDN